MGSCLLQVSPARSGRPLTARPGSPVVDGHRRQRPDILQACLGLLPGMFAADEQEGFFLAGGRWLSLQPRVHGRSGH